MPKKVARHHVYVIELDPAVLEHAKFRAANPSRDPRKPPLYVGMTGLDPEMRFERHKYGVKDNQYVRRYGVRLRPDLRRAQPPALRGGAAHGVGVGARAAQRRVCGVAEVTPGRKEMAKTSAGLLMFRLRNGEPEVLLVHPGGPFWAKKDEGAWSIPKGEFQAGEEPLAAAQREFAEETGCRAQGPFIPLTPITQRSGKVVHAWAVEGDCDPTQLHSNLFSLEWPPKSGKHQQFPEVDRAEWFSVPVALQKIIPAQRGFVTELAAGTASRVPRSPPGDAGRRG